ncbi:hypothetical protein QYF36_022122 [Acer negundo]|nr:hypothetical protein QYF36_022122 [Acer negundo]
MNKQIVIPVFYQVNPSDVRKQTGRFKDAFAKHKQVSGEELQKWREALTEASNLSGFDSSVTRPESRLVDEIVKDVLKKLNVIVEQLWEGKQNVPLLKRLILGHSQQLTRIPDLSESLQIIKRMGKARKKYQKEVRVSICYPGRFHEYSHGKLSMDGLASFKVMFKAPEDSSPSCSLKYCGLACGSSTVGFSLSVSFVDYVFLGCWCFLCFNYQLDVKLTCHLMYKIRGSTEGSAEVLID